MNAPQHQMVRCEFCGGNHDSIDCQVSASSKQVHSLGNFQGGQNNYQRPIQNQFPNRGQDRFLKPQANPQNDPYSSTYNPGWRNHPNFSYKNQNQEPTPPPPEFQAPQEKKSDLEDLIRSYLTSNERKWNNHEAFTKEQKVINKNMEASLRNLETQVRQLAHQLSDRRAHV